jgi:hypothetical protein
MNITTDPSNPCLKETRSDGQQECYLVLSEEERAKGFVRPVRHKYIHVGAPGPEFPLRDLTEGEKYQSRNDNPVPVKYESYGQSRLPKVGKRWTQAMLDNVGKGCGSMTSMGLDLAETYARNPRFYGATFCAHCGVHFPVGEDGEFVWEDGTRVGT